MPNIISLIKGCRRAALAAGLALIPAASAAASNGVALAPYVDCVHFNGDPANPVYTAYFGYNNTGGARFMFPIDGGGDNVVFPGSADGGQPTFYDPGNYPRVFAVDFDGKFIPTLSWTVNGVTVNATANSPACTNGATTPASDLGTTSATLNGVVTPEGEDTTYSFEYGTSASLGTSTRTQDAGLGTQPQLVQSALTGLVPSTEYFFRLDTTSPTTGITHGQIEKFTTPAPAPAPVARPTSIVSAAGADQTTTIRTAFPARLQAKVLDGAGAGVTGAPVIFAAPSAGASARFPGASTMAVVFTDSTGQATAPTLTANATPGTYSVTATVAGVTTPARFPMRNSVVVGRHGHHPRRHPRRDRRSRSTK
jgi:hypothetical protein